MTGNDLKKWLDDTESNASKLARKLKISPQAVSDQIAIKEKLIGDSFKMKLLKAGLIDVDGILKYPNNQMQEISELLTDQHKLLKELADTNKQNADLLREILKIMKK